MQNPRVCFLFGGNGPSCSVLGLHQMVSEALSNTLPAPPTHTHLLGRKMARWSSVQTVPLPLHSLTPPLLPLAAPAGFSPHPSNSSAPLLSFFSLSSSLISPPGQLDLSLASVPITLGLYPHSPATPHSLQFLQFSLKGSARFPWGGRSPV